MCVYKYSCRILWRPMCCMHMSLMYRYIQIYVFTHTHTHTHTRTHAHTHRFVAGQIGITIEASEERDAIAVNAVPQDLCVCVCVCLCVSLCVCLCVSVCVSVCHTHTQALNILPKDLVVGNRCERLEHDDGRPEGA